MIAEQKGKLPMTCPACEAAMVSISSLEGWMIANYACGSTYQDGRPPKFNLHCKVQVLRPAPTVQRRGVER